MATIVMSAARVIEAAGIVIADIRFEREQRNETMITKFMVPYTLFGFVVRKAPTREKVIQHLTEISWGSFPSCYAGRDLEHAKKLLTLAKHGDPVTLNEEDTRVLFS